MKLTRWLAVIGAAMLALGLTQAVWAHSFIDHCTPEAGSTVAQPPKEIRCVFSEAVDAKQTKFTVTDAGGAAVDNADLKSDPNDKDAKTVVITLNTAKVTGGIYTVKWQTVSEDGDATDGQWQFSVSAQPAAVPSIVLVSPTDESKFETDPSDVAVTIKVANFALGQNGRRWQVYVNGDLVTQVSDGSLSTMLKGMKKGDYALKVALATDDKTVVATTGMHLSVGPAATMPAPPPVLPKSGADVPAGMLLVAAMLVLAGLSLLAMAFALARISRQS